MAYVFVCPRCLRPSASEQDREHNYCGNCHAVTADPHELADMSAWDYQRWTQACQSWGVEPRRVRRLHPSPWAELTAAQTQPDRFGETRLTPAVLLTSSCWHYAGGDAECTTWTWSPLESLTAGIRAWVPEPSLGPFNASWGDDTLTVQVRTETMARAIMELLPLPGPVNRAWSWEELWPAWQAALPDLILARTPGRPWERYCPPQVQELEPGQLTARYLELREHGVSSMAARQLAEAEAAGLALSPAEWRSLAEAGTVALSDQPIDFRGRPDEGVTMAEAIEHLESLTAGVTLDDSRAAELYRLMTEFVGLDVPADGAGLPEAGSGENVPAGQIRERSARPPSWIADAVAVWDDCKDEARRTRSLAELAQDVADRTPQSPPAETGVDSNTAARWAPDDPGDVML